jgi:hypothetical protein
MFAVGRKYDRANVIQVDAEYYDVPRRYNMPGDEEILLRAVWRHIY